MLDKFLIQGLDGNKTLTGEVNISGAKNDALISIPAALLFKNSVSYENVPNISDIKNLLDLISGTGAVIEKKSPHSYNIGMSHLRSTSLSREIAKRIRASIVLVGPILARFGKVSFPHPGGCVLGPRPIDLFVKNFQKMGAKFSEGRDRYIFDTGKKKLKGAEIFFNPQSVTATETFMMAAVLQNNFKELPH